MDNDTYNNLIAILVGSAVINLTAAHKLMLELDKKAAKELQLAIEFAESAVDA